MLKTLLKTTIAILIILTLAIMAGAGQKAGLESFLAPPSDHLSINSVKAYSDKVVVNINKPRFVTYTDTNSMAPVIGVSTTGIEVQANPEKIEIGDIVSYEAKWSNKLVTHRIVGNGFDENGTYFILKGDANKKADPGKIRPHQIKYKVVALFY